MATAWKGTTLDDLPLLNAIDGTVIKPYITKGTPVSGDDVKGVWLHLKSPRTGWMNSGANMSKVRWETVTVTPPPPPPAKRLTNIIQVFEDGSINVTPQ